MPQPHRAAEPRTGADVQVAAWRRGQVAELAGDDPQRLLGVVHEQQVEFGARVGEVAQARIRSGGVGLGRVLLLLGRRLLVQQGQHLGAQIETMSTGTAPATHDAVVRPATDGVGAHAEQRGDVGDPQPVGRLGLACVPVLTRAHESLIGICSQNLTKAASEPPTADHTRRPGGRVPAVAVGRAVAPKNADGNLTGVVARPDERAESEEHGACRQSAGQGGAHHRRRQAEQHRFRHLQGVRAGRRHPGHRRYLGEGARVRRGFAPSGRHGVLAHRRPDQERPGAAVVAEAVAATGASTCWSTMPAWSSEGKEE